jgi:hypothetical protein
MATARLIYDKAVQLEDFSDRQVPHF